MCVVVGVCVAIGNDDQGIATDSVSDSGTQHQQQQQHQHNQQQQPTTTHTTNSNNNTNTHGVVELRFGT
jgi:hypothetical protein